MRTGRAAVFAAVCVLLASLGHVLMSGTHVPWWALAAAFAAAWGTGWVPADRERGPVLVTGLTVGVQAVLHLVFSLGQAAARPADGGTAAQWAALLCGPGEVTPAEAARLTEAAGLGGGSSGDGLSVVAVDLPDMAGMAGMAGVTGTAADMPGMDMGAHAAHQAAAAAAMPAHLPGGTAGMLAAHLLAALLVGLWLAAGERAVFRLGRTAAALLFAPLLLLVGLVRPPHRPPPRPARAVRARSPRRLLLVHAITSRGPPAGAAAV
ncbi:hypothetical protein KNE206_40500 [Kitasatospora sp. NE20-6]|uniref:hypothetical protein n=1 Tax=Kitasatospora sp. NE20-6 TaxID=2859066 RepID=UPI0034DC491C